MEAVVFEVRKDPNRRLSRVSSRRQGRAVAMSSCCCWAWRRRERRGERHEGKNKRGSRSTTTATAASKKKKIVKISINAEPKPKPFAALDAQPPCNDSVLSVAYLENGARRAPAVPETGGLCRFRKSTGRFSRVPAALCIGKRAANFIFGTVASVRVSS